MYEYIQSQSSAMCSSSEFCFVLASRLTGTAWLGWDVGDFLAVGSVILWQFFINIAEVSLTYIKFMYLLIQYYYKPITRTMNNPNSSQTSLASNSQSSKSNPHKKYNKFAVPSTPTPGIKKETSIDQLMHKISDVDRACEQGQGSQSGLSHGRLERSESGLLAGRSLRRVPFTPVKERWGRERRGKAAARPTLKQVVIKIKILLKDLDRILTGLHKKINDTMHTIFLDMESQIKNYLEKGRNESMIDNMGSNFEKCCVVGGQELQGKRKIIANGHYNREIEAFDQSVQVDIGNQESQARESAKRQGTSQKNSHIKGHLFSNMIHLREKLRKDATSTIIKVPRNPIQDSTPATPARGPSRPAPSPSPKKQMARSIEKLQKQLKSLHNILDE